jgi:hypothetical protein
LMWAWRCLYRTMTSFGGKVRDCDLSSLSFHHPLVQFPCPYQLRSSHLCGGAGNRSQPPTTFVVLSSSTNLRT